MIEVENLSKRYGDLVAVDGISFQIGEGEIVGFLGPNGAGKTTTMRMLTGYLPATGGTAKIAGFDIFTQSLEVRRRIGYLPEHPPVYADMTVGGYLDFVAKIKGVPSGQRSGRRDTVLGQCGLEDVRGRVIGALSKGYRQRVGLAQALIHDPQVLVLDEPTIGLDPKQIIEIRTLVKGLGGKHTVILSTHILPEVSMTCERVVVIHKGRIVGDQSIKDITARGSLEEAFLRLTAEDETAAA